jgi:hypothetical protein
MPLPPLAEPAEHPLVSFELAAVRVDPHVPSRCTSPSPPGVEQAEVVMLARSGQCGGALDALSRALDVSPDHCALAPLVVECFHGRHLAPIVEEGAVWNVDEIVPLLDHLEGSRADRELQLAQRPLLKSLPEVYRPPADGLERLLHEVQVSPRLRNVFTDAGGPGVVAFWGDILEVEVRIALGLSGLEPQPATDRILARRVYVVERAMAGPIGELLQTHRRATYATLRDRENQATREATGLVRDALETARLP